MWAVVLEAGPQPSGKQRGTYGGFEVRKSIEQLQELTSSIEITSDVSSTVPTVYVPYHSCQLSNSAYQIPCRK